jgi:hypothetical protein
LRQNHLIMAKAISFKPNNFQGLHFRNSYSREYSFVVFEKLKGLKN